ncbi:hypothetical protein CJP74_07215 [Psittacicella melopsittaci]|uniref:Uncharacterized protein n=1 Tax=Psittacicella melopsittaci TaxID=2028576 RepID=A0A3A1XZP5_9GAMM|nr:iron-containing alcohol dehydrogenase [Psittacicella melopsittaci]RIY31473.1 hypothetical protein CJP74_07215 [Psittacicella melopsittaci]
MQNFDFYNPTKVVFGTEQLSQLSTLIPRQAKIMLLYGKSSVKRLGILEQVKQALALPAYQIIEFGGIEPNPDIAQLVEAIYVARKNKVDYLLALGGGSVIDATKFISGHINYEQFDILLFDVNKDLFEVAEQDILFDSNNQEFINTPTPFGVVLTCPGTGSEMNRWAVISDKFRQIKIDFGHENLFPQFTIIDPSLTLSLPQRQVQNGVVDAMVHIFEQYLLVDTARNQNEVACQMAEGLLRVLWQYGPLTVAEPKNLEYRANFCWAATMALNGYLSVGLNEEDWSSHQIGHMLTALYDIEHAPSLAAVFIANLQQRFVAKTPALARFAHQVLGIKTKNPSKAAQQALERIADYFTRMQMPISLVDYRLQRPRVIMQYISQCMRKQNQRSFGEFAQVNKKMIYAIIKSQPLRIKERRRVKILSHLRVACKTYNFKKTKQTKK